MVKDVLTKIKSFAEESPNIDSVKIGDVYTVLNNNPANVFPAIIISQDNYNIDIKNKMMTIKLNIFAVDRDLHDDSNKLDIYEWASDFLYTLARKINKEWISNNIVQLYPFSHKFVDVCSGAWMTIIVTVPAGYCDNLE